MRTIYIHVGFHKTGTTHLQWEFFPKLKEHIYYINGLKYWDGCSHFTGFYKRWSAKMARKYLLEIKDQRDILVSNENFSLNIKKPNLEQSFNNLLECIPNCFRKKYIFVVRDEAEWIKSLYNENLIDSITNHDLPNFKTHINESYQKHYIEAVCQQVDEDDTLILRYEDLLTEPDKFYKKTLNFMGIECSDLLDLPKPSLIKNKSAKFHPNLLNKFLRIMGKRTFFRVFFGDLLLQSLRPKTIFPSSEEYTIYRVLAAIDRRTGPRYYVKGKEH